MRPTAPGPDDRNDPDRVVLAGLVGDVDRFASEAWGRRPFHRAATLDHAGLLTVDDVETLLRSGARRPTFRMVRNGARLPAERVTSPTRLAGAVLDDVADVERIGRELADGATLVVQGLQRLWPPVAELCDRLERWASHPVQANAYLTPVGATGLRPHRDEHDVLVWQLAGEKAWTVDGLGDVRMVPGDVVHLPAGTEHSAAATDTFSLHLTIGFLRVTYRAAVRRALGQLDDEMLDQPLPFGYARPEVADELRSGLADALDAASAALVALPRLDATLAAEVGRVGPPRRSAGGALASALTHHLVGPDDLVRRRDGLDATFDAVAPGPGASEECVVTLADRRLRLPSEMAAAVRLLLDGGAVRVADLPGLDEGSCVVLARRLAREGVIEWCAPDASAERVE